MKLACIEQSLSLILITDTDYSHVMDWNSKVEDIISTFFKSKKNSNCLLKLEELLLSTDEQCVLATLAVTSYTFTEIFSRDMFTTSIATNQCNEYKLWLCNIYEDFISHLLSYLSHSNSEIQISSLRVLMSFIQLERYRSYKVNQKEENIFPYLLFKRIISGITSDILDQQNLIRYFESYSQYDDVKIYVLKSIKVLLTEAHEITDLFLRNCFGLLCLIKFPKCFEDSISANTFIIQKGTFQIKEKSFRRLFSSIWNFFITSELASSFLIKVLCSLNENVLPYIQNPCLLADFLTNAYNKGGILSLLALKGLFILIEKYNLEYPDFFVKLYTLLDLSIINGKFGRRFFNLTNLFLSSTHLPAHIIAAFAKKLSRLSLISSTNNILKIISLLSNLLLNHPSLEVLIHQTNIEVPEDYFDLNTADPAESNALKSSLWELKTLQFHINPEVCSKAKQLVASYPKITSNFSNSSLYELYQKQRKRKFHEVPLSIFKTSFKQRRII